MNAPVAHGGGREGPPRPCSRGARTRRLLTAGLTILVAAVGCSVSKSQPTAGSMDNEFTTFDASVWKAQHQSGAPDNPRHPMLSEVEERVAPKGTPRAQVVAALGPPDDLTATSDVYTLGAAAFGVDYEQYVIEYDGQGKVSRSFVRRR